MKSVTASTVNAIKHRFRPILGVEMFYREAGRESAPAIVLLGGHPSGAHAYDGLIERPLTEVARHRPGLSGIRLQRSADRRDLDLRLAGSSDQLRCSKISA